MLMRGFALSSALLLNIMLVRLVSAQDMAIWLLFISIGGVLSALIGMGLPVLLGRDISAWRETQCSDFHLLVRSALWRLLSRGGGALALLLILHTLFPFYVEYFVVLACSMGALSSALSLYTELLRGFGATITAMLVEALPSLLTLLCVFAFLLSGYTPSVVGELVGISLLSIMLAWSVSIVWFNRIYTSHVTVVCQSDRGGVTGQPKSIGELAVDARPIGINELLMRFAGQADLWVASVFLETELMVAYGLATRFSILVNALRMTSRSVLQDEVPRLWVRGEIKLLRLRVFDRTRSDFVFALAVLSLFFVLGEGLVVLLFGARYAEAWSIGLVLLSGWALASGFGPSGLMLVLTGHQHVIPKRTSIAIALYLPILLVMADWWHGLGAALAAAGFHVFLAVHSAVLLRHKLGFWLFTRPD